jgi:hypothetical protein
MLQTPKAKRTTGVSDPQAAVMLLRQTLSAQPLDFPGAIQHLLENIKPGAALMGGPGQHGALQAPGFIAVG